MLSIKSILKKLFNQGLINKNVEKDDNYDLLITILKKKQEEEKKLKKIVIQKKQIKILREIIEEDKNGIYSNEEIITIYNSILESE